ncbi:MAG: hypothetical protein ACREUW_19165 [Burkholderiales bacterium]
MNSGKICGTFFAAIAAVMLVLGANGARGQGVGGDSVFATINEAHQYGVSVELEDLERAFWRCDYVATVKGMEHTPVDLCMAVTEEVKIRMFGGDFDRMHAWWQQHKPSALRTLAQLDEARRR